MYIRAVHSNILDNAFMDPGGGIGDVGNRNHSGLCVVIN